MGDSRQQGADTADPFVAAASTAENMAQAYALAQEAWAYYLSKHADGRGPDLDPYNIAPAIADLQKAVISDPKAMIDASIDLWQRQAMLWTNAMASMAGIEPEAAKATDGKIDKRFASEEWDSNIVFNYLRQSYQLSSGWLRDAVNKVDQTLPEDERKKLEFFTERFAEAMSPRNVFAMNPDVLKTTAEENGANIVRGLKQMLNDMKRGDGELWISQTDMSAFEVGRNIAVTPGSVVYQNDLIQLIQYTPTTEEVRETPILFAPPWINKFYILDLNEKKSLIRWMVAQGYTVFVISWRNPEAGGKERDFPDYITEGFYQALDAVIEETGVDRINCVGYCIGGTMLSTALAHMAQTGDERVKSATFFTAQADFRKAGDLRVFIDDKMLSAMAEEGERGGGVIGAQTMSQAFNMLRGNELIWDYVVNNYYLGKEPSAFDLLYWNADSTRMPAKCHLSYLRRYYRDNALAEGKMEMGGHKLDLGAVKTPIYSVSAREDHIAPAESVYRSMKLFGGPVKFVVGGSGHIAGVVNPPDPNKVKYQHWTSSVARSKWPDTVGEWIAAAKETPGSWWPDWDQWLSKRSGKMIPARDPGAVLGKIEPAPGSYVKVRSDHHSKAKQIMEAVLLGTGCPVVNSRRRGAATLIRQGSAQCLIDCGSGVTQRLVESGTNGAEVSALLLTHLHTDHLVDFYQLVMSSWHQGRDRPWEIYGPPPVLAHIREVMKLWEPERELRIEFEKRASVDGFELDLHEVSDGDVFRVGDLEVTTVEVDHGPVTPALGYVFETPDAKIVHSGDTGRSERLIEAGQGADLLIHEVFLHRHMQPGPHRSVSTIDNVASYHTLSSDVGAIARDMDVDTLVLTHFVPPEFDRAALLMEVGHTFEGSVFVGEDLMRFDLLHGEVAWKEMRARVL